MLYPADKEVAETVSVAENTSTPIPTPPVLQGEGWWSYKKYRILRALFEILLCSGVLTGLSAILLLRLLGIPDHLILTSPIYLAYLGGLEALLSLVLIWFFLKQRGQNWKNLVGSMRRMKPEILVGLSLIPLLLGSNLLLGYIFENYLPQWHSQSNPVLELIRTPQDLILFFFIALVVGGIKEEIQRAFILQRFRDDLGIPYLGLAAWSLLFGYGHAIQGTDSATGAALFGLLFGLAYLWRKNLIAPILAHCLYNSFILVGYWYWSWG